MARATSAGDFRVGAPRERKGWDQTDLGPALSDAATRGGFYVSGVVEVGVETLARCMDL